jgi:uncharacterized Fe-S cluster-containing MiaB family protein
MNAFQQCQNAGEQIDLFKALAIIDPPPIEAFVEILKTIQQQIINLAQILARESQVADTQKLKDNLDYEQRRITDIEESSLRQNLKRLQNEKHELQEKLTEVLSLAIQQAQINKVKHDLQISNKKK